MTETLHTAPDDAEQLLIGYALQGVAVDQMPVEPEDFYQPTLGELWRICRQLADRGERPAPINVLRACDGHRWAQDPAFSSRLHDMIAATTTGIDPHAAARLVTRAADRRRVSDIGLRLQQLATTDRDPDELLDLAQQLLTAPRRHQANLRMIGDGTSSFIDTLDGAVARGLPSPWPDMDQKTAGWHPGRLYVVGARPGQGKSLLGVNAATYLALRHQKASFIASIEMSEADLQKRVLADVSSVSQTAMDERTLTEADWGRISKAAATIADLPIAVDDTGDTLASIRAGARQAAKRYDLGLVVVDYLQLIRARDPRQPREQQVAEASRTLKRLARELNVPVIALAQLNREVAPGQLPTMANLRESGAIEADADVVLLLHAEEGASETTVIVGKNRHGPKGQFPLQMWGHYARFQSVRREPIGA